MYQFNSLKESKRSFSASKIEKSQDKKQGIQKLDSNMKSPQARNFNRIKQDDYFQDGNNKSNMNLITKKQDNTFNHRGRVFFPSKRDDSKQNDKIQIKLPKKQYQPSDQFQTQSITQTALSSNQINWDIELNSNPIQLNHLQKEEENESTLKDLRVSKLCSIECTDPSTPLNDKSNQHSSNQTKDNFAENKSNSLESLYINNKNKLIDGVSSSNIKMIKSESKVSDNIKISKLINNQISTNTQVPQVTGRWKKKLLRPKVVKKSFNQQNKLLLEDKQSDAEIEDDNTLNNNNIIKKLNSNSFHNITSPIQASNQINRENTDRNDEGIYLSENLLSLDQHIIGKDQPFTDQNNQNSLTQIDQQKTLQTENDGGENKRLFQSQLIIFDNDNEEQINEYNDTQQNFDDKTILHMAKQKSIQQKEVLDDLVEVLEDDNLSSSIQGEYEDNNGYVKSNVDFIPTTTQIKNNIQKEKKIFQKSDTSGQQLKIDLKSPIKKGKEQSQSEQQITQQYSEIGIKQDIQQYSPTKFNNNIEKQNSTKVSNIISNNLSEGENLSIHQDNLANKDINQKSQFVNQDQINCINQDDFTTIGGQKEIVTKTDKQQSPRSKFAQSCQNSVNQINQKGNNISLANLNNDSNYFGSESTNEPNSVKKHNLTSSQLSYNFGKYNKNTQDQKTYMSSQDSNNNSQETVKLQSNSKNFMEFAQYSIKRFPNEEEDEEKPEIIQYISKPFYTIPPASPQIYSNQTDLRASIDNLSNNQQQTTTLDHNLGIFSIIDLQQKQQNQEKQKKSDYVYGNRFEQKQQSEQNNIKHQNNEENNNWKNNRQNKPFEPIQQNSNAQYRKQSSNIQLNGSSHAELEQSSYMIDQTNVIVQNILKNNNSLNSKQQNDQEKNQRQIQNIQYIKSEDHSKNKQNLDKKGTFENHQESVFFNQNQLINIQGGKETNSHQKLSPSPLVSVNNVFFTDLAQKTTKINELLNTNQQDQIHPDEVVITVVEQNNINSLGKALQGDDSPSFWNFYKKRENEQRKFTCKELCYRLWPQTLDKKKRHDKQLILKLFQTGYNQDDLTHKSLFETVDQYHYRFLNGYFQQQIDDKHFSQKKFQRNSLLSQSNKLQDDEQKKSQSLKEIYTNSRHSFDLKAFTLIHLLAFLSVYKDLLDQSYRKLFKEKDLFLLLIKISNDVLTKFKQNVFDKCIKILNKDVIEFLNDLFYSIFLESINSIHFLQKFEGNKLAINLYQKLEQINKSLNKTEEIINFLQKNNPLQLKTIQTFSNIFH